MDISGNINEASINEILADCSEASSVFIRYGVDYCCKGKLTFEKVLNELNGQGKKLEEEIKTLLQKPHTNKTNYNTLTTDELISLIQEKHHNYFHINLPLINEYGQFALKGGVFNKEITELVKLFTELKDNINRYVYKEEHILFPYIHNLSEAFHNGLKIEIPFYRKISSSRNFNELENIKTHEILSKIRVIVSGINKTEEAGKTILTFLNKINELEVRICGHMHLMNNVLLAKCEEMEKVVGSDH